MTSNPVTIWNVVELAEKKKLQSADLSRNPVTLGRVQEVPNKRMERCGPQSI